MSWLYKAAFGTAEPSFEPQTVTFGRKSIQTTALLAEGGYSFVYTGVDPAGVHPGGNDQAGNDSAHVEPAGTHSQRVAKVKPTAMKAIPTMRFF